VELEGPEAGRFGGLLEQAAGRIHKDPHAEDLRRQLRPEAGRLFQAEGPGAARVEDEAQGRSPQLPGQAGIFGPSEAADLHEGHGAPPFRRRRAAPGSASAMREEPTSTA